MDTVFIPLITEGMKLVRKVIDAVTGRNALAPSTQVPTAMTPVKSVPVVEERVTEVKNVAEVNLTRYDMTQQNLTIIQFDKQFLKEIIEATEGYLANLIQTGTKEVLRELRRQAVKTAIRDVQAHVKVLRRLLTLKEITPELAAQQVNNLLVPLWVKIEAAKLTLQEHGATDAWNLCYLTGTSALLAGYSFLGQDMPSLTEELSQSMKDIQASMLNDIAKKMYQSGKKDLAFPWTQVADLLTMDGIDRLNDFYFSVVAQRKSTKAKKKTSPKDYNPSYMTVDEVKRAVRRIRDVDQLRRMLRTERGWASRPMAIGAIKTRLNKLSN